jgi:hypothetical protein
VAVKGGTLGDVGLARVTGRDGDELRAIWA